MNSSTEKYRILIVDDEPPLRSLLKEYLTKKGFNVFVADSAETALEVFKQVSPEAVISDIKMQKGDGIELLKNIRLTNTHVPVIIITAFPSLYSVTEAIKYNAYEYLIKPFNLTELSEKISSAIEFSTSNIDNLIIKEMASLHKVTSQLASFQSLPLLLTTLMDQCIKISRANFGAILLINDNQLTVANNLGIPYLIESSDLSNQTQWPVSKWVCKNKHPLLIKNGKIYPHVDISVYDEFAFNAGVSIPLLADDQLIGVLNLIRKDSDFTDSQLQVLHVLASVAGVAIDNARMYESQKSQLANLTMINEYSAPLMEKIERADIYNHFFTTLFKIFGDKIDFIAIFNSEKENTHITYSSNKNVSDFCIEKLKKLYIDKYNLNNKKTQTTQISFTATELFVTNPQKKTDALLSNIGDFIITPLYSQDNFFGAIILGTGEKPNLDSDTKSQINALVSHTSIALVNSKIYDDMKHNYFKTIRALAIAVDAKDSNTGGHSELVSKYAGLIAKEMNLSEKNISDIVNAGIIHDVGKIGIPGHILNKPGLLTSEEFNNIMKTHSTLGANIIKEMPFLSGLYELILHHHERFNGTGYPDGLKGGKIPLGARILCVADSYAAMISDRPYRKSLSEDEAYGEIIVNRGSKYDPFSLTIVSFKSSLSGDS